MSLMFTNRVHAVHPPRASSRGMHNVMWMPCKNVYSLLFLLLSLLLLCMLLWRCRGPAGDAALLSMPTHTHADESWSQYYPVLYCYIIIMCARVIVVVSFYIISHARTGAVSRNEEVTEQWRVYGGKTWRTDDPLWLFILLISPMY